MSETVRSSPAFRRLPLGVTSLFSSACALFRYCQNVISSLFMRLRTLSKTGYPASPVKSAPCTLFCKTRGGRGVRSWRLFMFHFNLPLSAPLLLRLSTFDIRPASFRPYSRTCPGGERETSFFGRCLGFTVQVYRHQQGRPTARAFWAEP